MPIAEAAVGKLWTHGALMVDLDDHVWPADGRWQPAYETVRAYRKAQLDEVLRFARSNVCRMVQLVRHFGEARELEPCGLCDICRPELRATRPSVSPAPKPKSVGRPARPPAADKPKRKPRTKTTARTQAAESDVASRLRQWRQITAKKRGIPAFLVFRDTTLLAIAAARPASVAALAKVPGVGPKLIEKYGTAIVHALRQN